MQPLEQHQIHLHDAGRKVHYTLPTLQATPEHAGPLFFQAAKTLIGLPAIGAALIFAGLAGYAWAWGVFGGLLFAMLPTLAGGFNALRAGLMAYAPNRSRITLHPKKLVWRLSTGWLRATNTTKLANIQHLHVVAVSKQDMRPFDLDDDATDQTEQFLLVICPRKGEYLSCAWLPNREATEALANDLAERINERLAAMTPAGQRPTSVSVGSGDTDDEVLDAYTRQPVESRAHVQVETNSVYVYLPPLGFRPFAGSIGLGVVCLMLALGFAALLMHVWLLILAVVIAALLVISMALIGVAVHHGRTSYVLDMNEAGVLITRRSPFRVRQFQWAWHELVDVGIKQGEQSLRHWLEFVDARGKRRKCLHDHSEVELMWIQAMVERARREFSTAAKTTDDGPEAPSTAASHHA